MNFKLKHSSQELTQKFARIVYYFVGSWTSIFLHTVAFAFWITTGRDTNLLTMWVSLEAIYLSIFILIAQNKEQIERDLQAKKDKDHELRLVNHDVQTNDLSLKEILAMKEEIKELKRIINILLNK